MGRRKRQGRDRVDVHAVLAGEVTLDASQLIDLIHRVNPTDRALGPAAEARRYQQKSALQSHLIKRFGDYLEVVEDGQPGVVSLRHRVTGRDAAHAVVAELDDDARSWITAWLDGAIEAPQLGSVSHRSSATRSSTGSTRSDSDPLAAGLAAHAEYDFPAAAELLRAAFAAHRGAPQAARALLSLLIDDLAAWSDPLVVAPSLPAESAADPEVAGLLCEAAGRRGDEAACRRWAAAASYARRARGLAAAAVSALDDGRLEDAQELLGLAGDDSAEPELRSARARLQAAREDGVAAAEQVLLRELEGASDADVLARCDRFLAAHPRRSRIRYLRAVTALRVAEPVLVEALERAEVALGEGKLGTAGRALAAAEDASPGDDRIGVLRHRLEQALEAREAEQAAARVEAELVAVGLDRALRLFDELTEPIRVRIAPALPPPFGRLLALRIADRRARAEECRHAVVAWCDAEVAFGQGEPTRADELLRAHVRLLKQLKSADELLREVARDAAGARAADAGELLRQATDALAQGDPDNAERLLDRIRSRDLSSRDREELERLREVAASARRTAYLNNSADATWASVAALLGAEPSPAAVPQLVNALATLSRIHAELPEAPTFAAREEQLRAAIAVHGRKEQLHAGFAPDDRNRPLHGPEAPTRLEADGDHFLIWAIGDRLVCQDTSSGSASRVVLPSGARPWWVLCDPTNDDELRVCDGHSVGTFDLRTLTPTAWLELPVGFDVAAEMEIGVGGRYLWIIDSGPSPNAAGEVHVVDLHTRRVRDLGTRATHLVGDLLGRAVVCQDFFGTATRWTTAGVPSPLFPSPLWGFRAGQFSLGRDARRAFLMLNPIGEHQEAIEELMGCPLEGSSVVFAILRPDGTPELLAPMPKLDGDNHTLSSGFDEPEGLILTNIVYPDGRRELRAWSSDGLAPCWTCPLPRDCETGLTLHRDTMRAKLRVRTIDGFADLELHRDHPPELPALASVPRGRLPQMTVSARSECGAWGGVLAPQEVEDCRKMTPQLLATVLEHQIERMRGAPGQILARALILEEAGKTAASERAVAAAVAAAPGHESVRWFQAARAAEVGAWERVLRRLDASSAAPTEAHEVHLRALALAGLDRWDEAADALSTALDLRGAEPCRLEALLHLVEPLRDRPGSLVSELRRAVREGDELLRAGNVEGAVALLDVAWLRGAGELQSSARLVEALLLVARDGALTAAAELALAGWLSLWDRGDAPNLPFPEGVWDDDRLAALAGRCRGRLAV